MFDAYSQNETEVGTSLDLVEEEILKGLPSMVDRLVNAYECEEYLAGRNRPYLKRKQSEEWTDYVKRPCRTSKLLRKVIRKLAEHLYKPGPTRQLAAPKAVQTWLNDVYEKCHINALMHKADQKANLNATSAIQVACTGRPEKPVSLYLFGAHEFVPFFGPASPTEPWAVATVHKESKHGGQGMRDRLRIELWSRDEHRVYHTVWHERAENYRDLFGIQARFIPELSGTLDAVGVNPYGCLPFAFVHDELPVTSFWEGGIGEALKECNEELDREISQIANHVKCCLDPDRFLRNVSPAWRREKRPDGWNLLVGDTKARQPESTAQAEAFVVAPPVNAEVGWYDVRQYADSMLEEIDVPLTAVRDGNPIEMSGIALQTKLAPLLDRARQRQVPFCSYEHDLAVTILTCAGNYYGERTLLTAAASPETALTCVWPEPTFSDPSPERDASDDWELQHGTKSLVDVVAERRGVTRDKAVELLAQVAKDNEAIAKYFPAGVPDSPGTQTPPATDPKEPAEPAEPAESPETDEADDQ